MIEKAIRIHSSDNAAVAVCSLYKGEKILGVTLSEDIEKGHKFALSPIAQGEDVIKYAFPIGHATSDIQVGAWIHSHNLQTNLGDILDYEYQHLQAQGHFDCYADRSFQGYLRRDGRAGIRNEIWIIPTVGCVNGTAQRLEKAAADLTPGGVYAFTHPYGCSQMGDDLENTQKILAAMVHHPNAGGVLVLGLGCENNHIEAFKEVVGPYDQTRVKFLGTQSVTDEMDEGMKLLKELAQSMAEDQRQTLSLSHLVIGLKCGGSDGFSGITANPLLGVVSDELIGAGGTSILTEVPEMFGAETIIMNRCKDESTFHKTVQLINNFKGYFQSHHQVIYENPSPGNKAGGITTLEEKSLGCTQKGGTSVVVDVLDYAQPVSQRGLNLLNGPGNDICAVTALMASGCQIVLFTTGRGTPLGGPIPTVKIATNTDLSRKKPHWIDFDAGTLLAGSSMNVLCEQLMNQIIAIANGEPARNEENGYREIAIIKNGVTL